MVLLLVMVGGRSDTSRNPHLDPHSPHHNAPDDRSTATLQDGQSAVTWSTWREEGRGAAVDRYVGGSGDNVYSPQVTIHRVLLCGPRVRCDRRICCQKGLRDLFCYKLCHQFFPVLSQRVGFQKPADVGVPLLCREETKQPIWDLNADKDNLHHKQGVPYHKR